MKMLIVDLPYPKVDNTNDLYSAEVISHAYATLQGELSATLQYVFQHFQFDQIDSEDAETLMEISLAEMKHFELLGESILALGGQPTYVQFPGSKVWYNTSTVSQSTTPQKMLMDDIVGEMGAIECYQKMLQVLKNEQVSALIERIILDEQLHLLTLKKLLEKYTKA